MTDHMGYSCDELTDAFLQSDPTKRLAARDEWNPILRSWLEECGNGGHLFPNGGWTEECARYRRLLDLLARCIHDPT